jgi:transmembrane sensor
MKPEFNIQFHKHLTQQLTADEEKELLDQISSDESMQNLASDYTHIWNDSETVMDNVTFDSGRAYAKFRAATQAPSTSADSVPQLTVVSSDKETSTPIYSLRTRFLKYAVSAAAIFALGFFAVKFVSGSNDYTTVNTNAVAATVHLLDGSDVKLAPNSTITYQTENFGSNRNVELKGSALFHVAKNGNQFVVHSNGFDVKVLGTTFYVSNKSGAKEVRVLEGKVEVSNKSSKVLITDRQGATVNEQAITFEENINFTDISNLSQDEMIYRNEPITKVISDLEIKFGVKMHFRVTQVLDGCTFTSNSLKNNKLSDIISLLEASFGTTFTKVGEKEYTIGALRCK